MDCEVVARNVTTKVPKNITKIIAKRFAKMPAGTTRKQKILRVIGNTTGNTGVNIVPNILGFALVIQ